MAQKPLHELLKQDQEPFLLNNYIADRRCQLKNPTPKTLLQIKKRKPISHNFCKNACFFSINNSPDLRKSPVFEFQSPAKSPCKTPNPIFLHIPAKTAALLLEAALRIQKQSSKPKSNSGFGLFGSLIKRITHRSKTRKHEINTVVKSEAMIMVNVDEKSGFSCSCNGRPSSAVWSESNEDKSWDLDLLETSSSGQTDHEEEEFVNQLIEVKGICDFDSHDNHLCESPFHFVLRRSPSSGNQTPVFSSPAASPSPSKAEDRENKHGNKIQGQKLKEEEEEKEQCSPVCVLDHPFEDDDDLCEDDGFDLECSYAIVQRAKQQLLQKLRRFEKLAALDPVELEKRMQEQEQECEEEEEEDDDDDVYEESDKEQDMEELIMEQLSKSSFCRTRKIPTDMRKLVSDLMNEEEEENYITERGSIVKRVCKRLEGWKEVESNTIDMMVEEDFKKQDDEWKRFQEQVGEAALEIEFGIFKLLVEELSEELAALT